MNDDAQCPVCGYYCLGKGGYGCIDKPSLVKQKLVPSAFNENIPTIPDHIPDTSKMNCSELPNGWISVDDRLPDDDVFVLVWLAEGEMEVFQWDTGYVEGWQITHWMPLPEPPNV